MLNLKNKIPHHAPCTRMSKFGRRPYYIQCDPLLESQKQGASLFFCLLHDIMHARTLLMMPQGVTLKM